MEDKEEFYNLLENDIKNIPNKDMGLIKGNFNVQIKKEKLKKKIAGKSSIHKRTGINRQKKSDLASSFDQIISSTKSKCNK